MFLYNNRIKKISVLLFFLLISTLWLLGLTYSTTSFGGNILKITDAINSDTIVDSDFETIGHLLPLIDQDLKRFSLITWPIVPVIKGLSITPVIGEHAVQVLPAFNYLSHIIKAANLTYPHLDRMRLLADTDLSAAQLTREIYHIASFGNMDFVLAAESLDKAKLFRSNLDLSLLPQEFGLIISSLDQHFELIQNGVHLLAVLPDMLGSTNQPANYLLLAQNRDELRGTGGFITGIGKIEIAAGELLAVEIGDSYNVDDFSKNYPPPPDPIQTFMLAGYWVPRDGNWSPDFPTAALKIQELYQISMDHQINGVIAFDQDALKILVSLIEPLQLDEFEIPITSKNIEMVMQQARAPFGEETETSEWSKHRKDFMVPIGEAIISQVLELRDHEQLVQLGKGIFRAIETGHLLLYFNQPEAQWILSNAGLDHSLNPGEGDYIYLVDSNVGFNKADSVVERSLTYLVDFSNQHQIAAMLIARYTHTITEEISCDYDPSPNNKYYSLTQKRCYLDYWRLYKNSGSQINSSNTTPIPGSWLLNGQDWPGDITISAGHDGSEEISGLFMLPTAQSSEIVLQMYLPPYVLETFSDETYKYRLKIQKQAGLSRLPVVLQIKAPLGYLMSDQEAGWHYNADSGFWLWSGQLESNKIIELVFIPRQGQ